MRRFSIVVAMAVLAMASSATAQTPHLDLDPHLNLGPHLNLHDADQGVPGHNVKLDLTITDTYTGTPSDKTVSMLMQSGGTGMIRTSNRLPNGAEVSLNVDARVETLDADTVRVMVTFEYTPAQSQESGAGRAPNPAELHESLTVLLKDGEPLVVSRSADPATDRTVTVELTATILR